jgi:hypothetical protein
MKPVESFLTLLKLCGIWFAAWIIGCLASTVQCYVTAQDFIFQGINYGNNASDCAVETAAYSFVIIMPAFPILYLPILFGLRWLLGGVKPAFIFPLVSALIYLIPMGYIYHSKFPEGWIEALFDPAGEFSVVLAVTGFFFGLGFAWLFSKRAPQQSLKAEPR